MKRISRSFFARPLLLLPLALVFGVVLGVGVSACSDRPATSQTCYPPDREWETDDIGLPLGFCKWPRGGAASYEDVPPGIGVTGYSYCFVPEEGEVCDACPAEETDERVKAQFEAECGKEVQYYERGCYNDTPDQDGNPRCCYKALIGPLCELIDDRDPTG